MDTFSKNLPTGYMGKILIIDLGSKKIREEKLDPEIACLFHGNRGLGVAYLYRHFKRLEESGKYRNAFKEVDPLSSDNVAIISTAPSTATKMPTSGRVHMNFKSPLTGGYGSANSGGYWGVNFKRTGYDMLILEGKSEKPVYLVIKNKSVEIKNADVLESMNSEEIQKHFKEDSPEKMQVLSIGEAGKNLSLFANVMSDKGRTFGRGGAGAVFGSKNLIAIAVSPDKGTKVSVSNEEEMDIKNKSGSVYKAKVKLDVGKFTRKEQHYGSLASMGSLGLAGMVNNFNQLIHNNMIDTRHELSDIDRIDGEALRNYSKIADKGSDTIEVKKDTCYNCSITCKRKTTVKNSKGNVIDAGEGPEFETVALLGANLSIYDLPLIARANYQANRYGMDTITLGSTIAAFVELYTIVKDTDSDLSEGEKLFLEDLEDFDKKHGEPRFGNKEYLLSLIVMVGKGEGIGKYLALGSYRFCERYGHPELSMTVKKQELPAYDPRTSYSQALCYEMSNRGGCHLEGGYTAALSYCAGYAEWPGNRIEGTPLISKNATLKGTAIDIIGVCVYSSFAITLDEYAPIINAVTGDNLNSGSLLKFAHRTVSLERLFNIMCGKTENDDWLPDRFYEIPTKVEGEDTLCSREVFRRMHKEYYRALGWNDDGVPENKTLRNLGMEEFIPEEQLAG
ncbi:MAG: aldehyde ferredoxin oxidoreductase family protein [Spirochaetales bacterium]|nr:aldehyde ferredoxin oxidoreductase family protein [Spirochaetales bacterium]